MYFEKRQIDQCEMEYRCLWELRVTSEAFGFFVRWFVTTFMSKKS
ncbi:hypothetical protein VCR8J2_190446 [Vibrio coralliirubri]|nr:hypothetical protein VCR8J2_190446 [Vibrio coralliirubri]